MAGFDHQPNACRANAIQSYTRIYSTGEEKWGKGLQLRLILLFSRKNRWKSVQHPRIPRSITPRQTRTSPGKNGNEQRVQRRHTQTQPHEVKHVIQKWKYPGQCAQ